MKYDVITIGGATEDITFYTKEGVLIDNKEDILRQKLLAFEFGAKLKIDRAYSTFGGGAANAAVCLAYLGFKIATMVAVGYDNRGKSIIENLHRKKVDTSLVQKIKNVESGFSLLLAGPANEHIVFSNRAANKFLSVGTKEIEQLNQAEWIYMTSMSGNWHGVLDNVFKVRGPKIVWNPGHIQLHTGVKVLGKYLKKTEILVVNKDEAIELVVSDPKNKNKDRVFLDEIKNLLVIIKSWGPKVVVITNGKYGADAYDGKYFYHQVIIKERKRVDTTGVGDCFGSTFIAGMELFGGNIKKTMWICAKNTAGNISIQGAQEGIYTRRYLLESLPKDI
jgi:ribokinase